MSPEPSRPESIEPRWSGLTIAAAASAALTALLIPLQFVTFIGWPPPASRSVDVWFALFGSTPLLGLLSLDLLMMVEQLLAIPIVIGLWIVLRRSSESLVTLGSVLWLVGATLLVGSNTGFEMLSLSHGYAAATGEAARAAYLAAGQGMLASYFDMGSGFVFGYVLTSVGGIMIGFGMLRSAAFGRVAGWALVVANVVAFGIFLPGIGIGLALLSVVILFAWYVLVARRFLGLALALRTRNGDAGSTMGSQA